MRSFFWKGKELQMEKLPSFGVSGTRTTNMKQEPPKIQDHTLHKIYIGWLL
jgi:hypothetical protein